MFRNTEAPQVPVSLARAGGLVDHNQSSSSTAPSGWVGWAAVVAPNSGAIPQHVINGHLSTPKFNIQWRGVVTKPTIFFFIRFDWVQSEKAVTLHVYTKNTVSYQLEVKIAFFKLNSFLAIFQNLKASDVTIDMSERTLEAAIFIYDWVFEIRLGKWSAVKC